MALPHASTLPDTQCPGPYLLPVWVLSVACLALKDQTSRTAEPILLLVLLHIDFQAAASHQCHLSAGAVRAVHAVPAVGAEHVVRAVCAVYGVDGVRAERARAWQCASA